MTKNLYFYEARLKNGGTTWALLPVDTTSAILDATYLPDEKGLLIMIREKKETFIERPITNDRGEISRKADGTVRTREAKFDTYYEHFMANEADIQKFVETFAINYDGRSLFSTSSVSAEKIPVVNEIASA